jgi:uncharacterized iron-regulated membrane protein
LIVPLSLSGSALVWHDWLDDAINPQRHIAGSGEAVLPVSSYVLAARARIDSGSAISSLRFMDGRAALAVAGSGPLSQRTNVWIDPENGEVLDAAAGDAELSRKLHTFHASMYIPRVGNLIVGGLGLAMLVSSLTGLWLWWPTAGRVLRALRWRRSKDNFANLHHQVGFWICLPLGMLSFTGIWIVLSPFFAALSGDAQQKRAENVARWWAKPVVSTSVSVDAAAAKALTSIPGKLVSIAWPTDFEANWRVQIAHSGKVTELTIADATGETKRVGDVDQKSGGSERISERLHAGYGMGLIWQIAIFIGGITPLVLGTTGLVMWWRSRGWRADVERRMYDRKLD